MTRSGWHGVAVPVAVVFETHSTSEDNEAGLATGWFGGRLSERGREQAVRLGRRRRQDGIDVVFTSDLNRAVETAQIAFGTTDIPVLLDWRLRECNYGCMNGMPSNRLDAERGSRLDEPFPGGESWREAVQRVGGFLDELAEERDGQRVLVIGHAATRWALDLQVCDRALEQLLAEPFHWKEGWTYTLHRCVG
jgi:2,3-bisphosphoglycerate-dependent phosphoglycerate mutase